MGNRLVRPAMLAALAAGAPALAGQAADHADAYLVRPQVVYPLAALREGINGRCEVSLTVSPEGRAQDTSLRCSHPLFEQAAHEAIAAVRFNPAGPVKPGDRLVIPLEFRIAE